MKKKYYIKNLIKFLLEIVQIQLFNYKKYLKIYLIVNENIHYIAMFLLDKVDDIILLDQNFIIQIYNIR